MSQEVIRGIALPPAAQPGDPLARVDTPSLALDLAAFEANLRAMQAWADRHGVALRPTPRPSVPRSRCASWRWRARHLLPEGQRGPALRRRRRARHPHQQRGGGPGQAGAAGQLARARISVCVDNAANLAHISRAMAGAGVEVDVLVEIDVGQGRCGASDEATVLALAQQARDLPGVNFAGLQAYHGSVQHARGREERARICRDAARIAASHAQLLRESGIACDTITGGGTGSVEFDAASGVYTELQAGSYASWTATTAPTNGAGR